MRSSHRASASLLSVSVLAACATSTEPSPPRPFFLVQQAADTHGRKTWFDRLIETDPGGTTFSVAGDYQERPPQRIAVLPFVDHGNGDYVVNKLPILDRSEAERDEWSWTHANRLRHSVIGALAAREFVVVPPLFIDAVLAHRGVTDRDRLRAIPAADLGRWLNVDTVVYGELLDYEGYYAFLMAAWEVTTRITMVSTIDGREIFSCTDSRFDATVSLTFDPIDIGIASVLNLLKFRDVSLARTEYEVGREIILRLPKAERNLSEFRRAALGGEGDVTTDP